ncbi:hypothetical protein [Veillonella sp. T11011-6]|uniref:hypothetical protein n=1 Tax=Veillonella sp. T11011-6 TaxID=2027459 RepID=UPI000CF3721D|nr:hypothetical protein [Veillonella sp. T11011-6]PQL10232.1 hypothetical protein VRHSUH10_06955 [Veillonella sp. T11011-6]
MRRAITIVCALIIIIISIFLYWQANIAKALGGMFGASLVDGYIGILSSAIGFVGGLFLLFKSKSMKVLTCVGTLLVVTGVLDIVTATFFKDLMVWGAAFILFGLLVFFIGRTFNNQITQPEE